jgi:sulfoacetaldehyde dehydrogenase
MNIFEYYEQQRVDEVVAWAILRENTEELARLAVEDTGLGNYKYKANKSRRKSLGTLR